MSFCRGKKRHSDEFGLRSVIIQKTRFYSKCAASIAARAERIDSEPNKACGLLVHGKGATVAPFVSDPLRLSGSIYTPRPKNVISVKR